MIRLLTICYLRGWQSGRRHVIYAVKTAFRGGLGSVPLSAKILARPMETSAWPLRRPDAVTWEPIRITVLQDYSFTGLQFYRITVFDDTATARGRGLGTAIVRSPPDCSLGGTNDVPFATLLSAQIAEWQKACRLCHQGGVSFRGRRGGGEVGGARVRRGGAGSVGRLKVTVDGCE